MSDFEQYLIDSFGETWERSGIMDAHNAALAAERESGRRVVMQVLQSERYTNDPEYRDATDAVLAQIGVNE